MVAREVGRVFCFVPFSGYDAAFGRKSLVLSRHGWCLGAKRETDVPLYVVEKHTIGMQVERYRKRRDRGGMWRVAG